MLRKLVNLRHNLKKQQIIAIYGQIFYYITIAINEKQCYSVANLSTNVFGRWNKRRNAFLIGIVSLLPVTFVPGWRRCEAILLY